MTCKEQYNVLKLDMIMKKKGEVVSSKQALKDVKPISWPDDVLQRGKSVVLQKKKHKGEI